MKPKSGETADEWKGHKARPSNRANTWQKKAEPRKDRRNWKRKHSNEQ